MRLLLVVLAAAVSVTAHPHRHAHLHGHLHRAVAKRDADYAPAPVATVVVYVLNGQPISEGEVRQGIANGTLMWGADGNLSTSTSAVATPTRLPTPAAYEAGPVPNSQASSRTSAAQTSAAAETPTTQPPTYSNPDDGFEGIDREFPNGQFSCDTFPKGYGAEPIEHAGLGGWIGIQDPGFAGGNGFDDIMTVPHGSCPDGGCCTPGSFCSYSCPPGYLKAAWPELQGIRGQSVGGLYCNLDGKLERPEGLKGKTLCVRGTDKVTVMVDNRLSKAESICRTDYPGTESETIPITTEPGQSKELACPNNQQYYQWEGKPTSAQYYINPKGVPENEACQWGDDSRDIGNWAPVNLGVGFDAASQRAYVSLFPNAPTNPDGKLDFAVELVADGLEGRCKYSNGQYYFGNGYAESSPTKGCTVALGSGTLKVVLTDN